jgi:hypothetical protein
MYRIFGRSLTAACSEILLSRRLREPTMTGYVNEHESPLTTITLPFLRTSKRSFRSETCSRERETLSRQALPIELFIGSLNRDVSGSVAQLSLMQNVSESPAKFTEPAGLVATASGGRAQMINTMMEEIAKRGAEIRSRLFFCFVMMLRLAGVGSQGAASPAAESEHRGGLDSSCMHMTHSKIPALSLQKSQGQGRGTLFDDASCTAGLCPAGQPRAAVPTCSP